jgi:hypothetical protein
MLTTRRNLKGENSSMLTIFYSHPNKRRTEIRNSTLTERKQEAKGDLEQIIL